MKHIIAIGLLMICSIVFCQTIENVDFHAEGQTIVVTYDLNGCASNEKYSVSLTFESQTRLSFDPSKPSDKVFPKTLSGDLSNITCGSKKIVWDIFKDRSSFEGKYQVKISVLTAPKDVKDIDGNIYKTVQIGEQIWFAENLRTSKYNDGTPIPNVTDATSWSDINTGAYCFLENNANNNSTYGKLYNWYAVDTKKLCPIGWHVVSLTEWDQLVKYLGGDVSKQIKNTSGWLENGNGTNESGFSGLPGGFRDYWGAFHGNGKLSCWWSASVGNWYLAWRLLDFNFTYQMGERYANVLGMYVRCIKD